MIFYRGITVEPTKKNDIIQEIKTNGITGKEGKSYPVYDMKYNLSEFLNNPDINIDITQPSKRVYYKGGFETEYIDCVDCVCCSSDINTAAYYANKHNKYGTDTEPLIIKFEMPISDVYIDGRDFLYTSFYNNDTSRVISILTDLYGDKIADYYEKAITKKDTKYRDAIVDLVCQDEDIIKHHYNNNKYIRGRHKVVFKSSFMVKSPILANQIIEISSTEYIEPSNFAYTMSDIHNV